MTLAWSIVTLVGATLTLLIIWKLILARWSRSTQTKQKNHNLHTGCGSRQLATHFATRRAHFFTSLLRLKFFPACFT